MVSRFLGFVRQTVLSHTYGADARVDAYVAGLFVVNTVAAMLLYILVTSVIPIFQHEEHEHGTASAWALLSSILVWVGAALVALTGLVAIWPEAVTTLFGFEADTARLAQRLLRIMAPALMLQGLSAVFTALLQIRGSFSRPAAIGVAFNAGIIVGVLALNPVIGIRGAAWGVLLGAVLQVVLQLPEFLRFWRAGEARLRVRHPRLAASAVLALPVAAATLSQQINSFTDQLFINLADLEDGRIAALNFASSLGTAPRTAILFPLLVPLFPHVSRLITQSRLDEARRGFMRAAGLLGLVAIPLSVFMAVEAHGLARVAFQHGDCQVDCRVQIGRPVVFYGLAVWGAFMVYLLNRTLSAARKPGEILAATLATVGVVIGLDLLFIRPLEQAGLALASMIGTYVNSAIMLWFLRRELDGFDLRAFLLQQGRLLACATPAAGALLALDRVAPSADHPLVVTLVVVIGKGLGVFAVFAACVRAWAPAEFRSARDAVGSVLNRRRRGSAPS